MAMPSSDFAEVVTLWQLQQWALGMQKHSVHIKQIQKMNSKHQK